MGSELLDTLIARIEGMDDADRKAITEMAAAQTADMVWLPVPGPQTDAYFSEADDLFFGGGAGCGKTDLAAGLALTAHKKSLILRRFRDDVKDIHGRIEDILGTSEGRNNADLLWDLGDRSIKLTGCKMEGDKERFKGKPFDLYVFDEIADFTRSQFEFIKTWNRSAVPGQRCRVVCCGNPPTTPEGLWVIEYWAAWLDPKHPNPAKSGEIRWYAVDKDGKEHEVQGEGPHLLRHKDGSTEKVRARSRTFIRASLSDNPYLAKTSYGATLDALPYEIRKAYRDGIFDANLEEDPNQVIPTQWVLEAQYRWEETPPDKVPMCAIGVDIAFGGKDNLVLAPRHGSWYGRLISKPGKEIEHTDDIIAEISRIRRDNALVIPDTGGGYAQSLMESMDSNKIPYTPYKGSAGSTYTSKCGIFTFPRIRAETYWRFREALDPNQPGGSRIALPPSRRLLADLTAPKFTVKKGQSGSMEIHITEKKDLVKTLGRSPDEGDAVVMAYFDGAKEETHAPLWLSQTNRPSVNMGHDAKRRKRR